MALATVQGGEAWSEQAGRPIEVEGWEVFQVRDKIDKETGWPIDPQTKKPIPQPMILVHQCIPRERQPDYICWQLANGVPSEHDRLYYRVDYVRVWEQWAYMRTQQAVTNSIPRPKQ